MELCKSVVLILPILWQTNQAFSEFGVKLDEFEEMTEQVGKLLSDCTRLRVNNIAVVSDSEATVKWTPKSLERISLLNLKIVNPRDPFLLNITWHEKFHTFIILTSLRENLAYLIKGLRHTRLWNYKALYVLFDNLTLETGCDNAENFLFTTWDLDLLSSTFFCVDRIKGFMMYTFNPFTEWAPKWWKKHGTRKNVIIIKDVNYPNWTSFKRKLIPGVTTCKDVTFVKTMTLNNYPIGVKDVFEFRIKSFRDELFYRDLMILERVNKHWNANYYIVGYTNQLDHILTSPLRSEIDVLKNPQYIESSGDLTMTYAFAISEFGIMTRKPDYEEEYKKILTFMSPMFITGTLLISLATAIVLGKCTGQGVTSGCLEVLRIIVGGSMTRVPETNPLRIAMLTILLLSIISTCTFQGNLSSLLTAPVLQPPIENLEDLKESGFPIYVSDADMLTLTDEIDKSGIRSSDVWSCIDKIEKFENVACIADKRRWLQRYNYCLNDVYISQGSIRNMYLTFIVRPNWPLTEEFTLMLIRQHQTGILDVYGPEIMPPTEFSSRWREIRNEANSGYFQILKLQNLMFAFYILLFGHVVSIIVFIGEVLIWRQRMKKMRTTLPLGKMLVASIVVFVDEVLLCRLRKRRTRRGNGKKVILPFVR